MLLRGFLVASSLRGLAQPFLPLVEGGLGELIFPAVGGDGEFGAGLVNERVSPERLVATDSIFHGGLDFKSKNFQSIPLVKMYSKERSQCIDFKNGAVQSFVATIITFPVKKKNLDSLAN